MCAEIALCLFAWSLHDRPLETGSPVRGGGVGGDAPLLQASWCRVDVVDDGNDARVGGRTHRLFRACERLLLLCGEGHL